MEILGAAASSFRNRGFAATGMREIAAAADLSPANVYHYFRGKQELLYFCQDASLVRLLEALETARRSRRPAAEKLHFVIAAHARCVLGEMVGATAHLEIDDLPATLRRRLLVKRDRYEHGIRRIVAAGMRSGEFAPCDPKLVTQAILGALNWTARWYRPEGALRPEHVGEAFAVYLVRGLAKGRAHARRNGGKRA